MSAFIGGLVGFFVPTHLLAAVALGLLGGQATRRNSTLMLAALAIGFSVGAFVVASAVREMPSSLALLALAAATASLVVIARPMPLWIASLLALAAGAALALNVPPQAITISGAIAEQCGSAVAALATFAFVTFIALKAERPWQRIGVRIVASWIAASAILVLALRLAR